MALPRNNSSLHSVLANYLSSSAQEEKIVLLPASGLTGESWRLHGAGFDLLVREASR
ncbi:hypothetical protein [Sodalis endosymbiont of Henestaris halophilus]